MKVEKTASGRFRISEGDLSLEVTQASFEDLYYALPLDPPTLFLLLNETVLNRKEDREILKKIVAVYGNIQSAMPVMAREVERCDPKTAEVEVPVVGTSDGGPATDSETRISLAGLVEEVVTRKPGAPRPAASGAPAVPSARPPGKGKTRKTRKSKIRQAQALAAQADDDIPVAEVVTPSTRSAPAAAPPAPAPVATRGAAPAAGEKRRQLGVMMTPDIEFWITDGELVIRLTQKRYEELHRSLPLDNTTLYRFLNDSILKAPEERERFQELVRRSGGVDAALTLLQQQIKMLPPDPTAAIPVRKPSMIETPLARPSSVPPRAPSATAPAASRPGAPAAASRPAAPAAAPRPSTPGALAPGARVPAAASQKQPAAGARILDLEIESQTGEKFRIIYGNLMLTLGKAQYQELYYSLPSDNVSLFRLLFTKVLTDGESRNTLKKMVEKAGSNKLFFDSLQIRVREVTPTQSWD
ncbi:MAG: hypothetical protein AAB434_08330 [Planctomycetota bacterium]